MTARFTTDPPLASSDTWAGRQAPSIERRLREFDDAMEALEAEDDLMPPCSHIDYGDCHECEQKRKALKAERAARAPTTKHRFYNVSCSQCGQDFGPGDHGFSHCADHAGGVTPLAEHLVLDCLRALKAIYPSQHAMQLADMISRGYLETPNQITRMRRITALLEIDAEDHAP